jgi:class 3 adenylate cyclase
MFTDVRGFTPMAAALTPSEVVAVLNEHFNSITEVAHRHGGTIFNMVGDGMLIGFGVPIPVAAPCHAALAAAQEMQAEFHVIGDRVQQRHGITIGLGIGISHGPVIMGNVGSDRFLSFTIIGDTVNVASRVQALAEAGMIVMTQPVHEAVQDRLAGHTLRTLDDVKLRGKAAGQMLYQLAAA